jgi:hypothetical protein
MRIRIHCFEAKNIKILKLNILFLFQKITILLSLGLCEGYPSYRRSLQPSKRTSNTSEHDFLNFIFL